jgi:tetratricopeptide (TPR) repeat protein
MIDALIGHYRRGHMARVIDQGEALAGTTSGSVLLFDVLGAAYAALRRFDLAGGAFARGLALQPRHASAHYNLGNALQHQGRLDEAAASYVRATAIKPDYAEAHSALGGVHLRQDRLEQAAASFARVIAISPGDADAHRSLGNVLRKLDRPEDAMARYRRAIAIRPDYAEAHNNLGNALTEQGRLDEAVASYSRAIAIDASYPEAHSNLGAALQEQGRLDAATASFARAVALRPDYAQARWNAALLSLLRGDFERGWAEYEWRKKKDKPVAARSFAQPLWLGAEALGGKAVFLHAEQGLGDTLQFARYALLVRDLGAAVTLSVQPALLPLIRGSLTGMDIIPQGAVPANFDYHAPLLSLPLALGTRLDTVPAAVPYLAADDARRDKWAARLGIRGFKIGICWQGSGGKADLGRSFPLSALAGIAALPGTRLISLHKGSGEAQLQDLPAGMRVEVPGPDFDPDGEAFLDTAAIMRLCDLVITCDTAIAHLAGALGVPVWVMLKHVPDFRWLMDRGSSPWYPTMRLFRQQQPGDWMPVFASVQRELTQMRLTNL